MTVTLDRERSTARLFDPGGDRTLDDLVTTAWGSLCLRGSARCLVCGTAVARDAEGQAAGCPACGSNLE